MQKSMDFLKVKRNTSKWKINSVPLERVVQYSFLLKQKREFQQVIDQLENQVTFQNNLSSCCIVDKIKPSAGKKNMNIYIFDDSKYCKNILLKILVPLKHLRKKINLLFRFSSQNNTVFRFKDQNMYIKCTDGQIWNIFYNFFEFLMKKSSQNIIGTQFYVPLVCKYFFTKELIFLQSKSSRPICKPQYTRRNIKILLSNSSQKGLAKTHPKNNIKPVELLKEQFVSRVCDSKMPIVSFKVKEKSDSFNLKRKSIDFETCNQFEPLNDNHNFSKKMCTYHARNKWKDFQKIGKQPVIKYIDILKGEGMFDNSELSNVLSDGPESIQSSTSLQAHQSNRTSLYYDKNLYSKCETTKEVKLSLKSTHQIPIITFGVSFHKTKNVCQNLQCNESVAKRNKTLALNKLDDEISKDVTEDHYKFRDNVIFDKSCFQESADLDKENCSNTLNRNNVNESKKKVEYNELKSTSRSNFKLSNSSLGFRSPLSKEYKNSPKQHIKSLALINDGKRDMPIISSLTASKNVVNEINQQPMGFSTAAGKSLKVSEKAILAAQKMFEEVCSQETNIIENNICNTSVSSGKKPAYPEENFTETDFNSEFSEKFFEEIPFEDTEVESKPKDSLIKTSSFISVKSQAGKMRKSLGGRRSLKPYGLKN